MIFAFALTLPLVACKKEDDNQNNNEGPVYSETTPSFSANSNLNATGNTHYFPYVFASTSDPMVLWSEKDGTDTKVRGVKLSGTAASGSTIDALTDLGIQNSGESTNHAIAFDESTSKYLAVVMHNETSDFGMRAKLFTSTDQSEVLFDVEGPYQYAPTANRPAIASNNNGIFGLVYHTNSGFYSDSKIAFKTINASTGEVSPAAASESITGIEISGVQCQFPDIAWNASANVFGIVYHTGVTSSSKVMFTSVDVNGNVVTAPTAIYSNATTGQFPKIKEDGSGFAVMWQEFGAVKFGEDTELTGVPHIMFKRITATGGDVAVTGDANIVDTEKNTVIMSNPYLAEAYIHFDLVVKTAGSEYGLVWATQNAPYQIQFAKALYSGNEVTTTAPVDLSVSTEQSDKPTIDFAAGQYVITYVGHNGSKSETRIVAGN